MERPEPVEELEAVLRRDRVIVGASLTAVVVLAWAYMLYLARGMSSMSANGMAMPQMQSWGSVDLALLFVMWAVKETKGKELEDMQG